MIAFLYHHVTECFLKFLFLFPNDNMFWKCLCDTGKFSTLMKIVKQRTLKWCKSHEEINERMQSTFCNYYDHSKMVATYLVKQWVKEWLYLWKSWRYKCLYSELLINKSFHNSWHSNSIYFDKITRYPLHSRKW